MHKRLDDEVRDYIKSHLTEHPNEPCDFKVGDVVTFTNDYGVVFEGNIVIGFSYDVDLNRHIPNGSPKRIVHTISKNHNEAYWFPKRTTSLKSEGIRYFFENHLGFMS